MFKAAGAGPIYTIGHSTRTIEEFVELLRTGGVRRVIDVRSIPRSRTNPQYNLDVLGEALAGWQIGYALIPELGGRRGLQKTVAPEVNGFWKNQSFHNYADYAMSDEFHTGLERLLGSSAEMPCAIMCAEAVWWRCHRRIIADYLLHEGRSVLHLMGKDRIDPARLTPAARSDHGVLAYPQDDIGTSLSVPLLT
ncbi:MAG TPA: DUF488 domain-containing protein [Sphingomonas sp.]|nr:DUF488 domain-containing protein [Sphingomonas sp.]